MTEELKIEKVNIRVIIWAIVSERLEIMEGSAPFETKEEQQLQ
jgi:hypothetical protein